MPPDVCGRWFWGEQLYPHFVPDMPGSHGVEGASGDWEQDALPVTGENLPGQRTGGGRPFYTACGWACLYVLAATPAQKADPPRFSLQMVHEWDSCCFRAANLHENISHYNIFVQSQLSDGKSWFQTSANLGERIGRAIRTPFANAMCCVVLWCAVLCRQFSRD